MKLIKSILAVLAAIGAAIVGVMLLQGRPNGQLDMGEIDEETERKKAEAIADAEAELEAERLQHASNVKRISDDHDRRVAELSSDDDALDRALRESERRWRESNS